MKPNFFSCMLTQFSKISRCFTRTPSCFSCTVPIRLKFITDFIYQSIPFKVPSTFYKGIFLLESIIQTYSKTSKHLSTTIFIHKNNNSDRYFNRLFVRLWVVFGVSCFLRFYYFLQQEWFWIWLNLIDPLFLGTQFESF